MEQRRQLRYTATEDFPLSVTYFSPLGISTKGSILQNDSHSEMEFMIIHKGLVEIHIDGQRQVYTGGTYLFISPWQTHNMRTLDMSTYYIILRFSPALFGFPENHFFTTRVLRPLDQCQLRLPRVIQSDHLAYGQLKQLTAILDAQREYTDDYRIQLMSMILGMFSVLLPYCDHADREETRKNTPTTVTRQVLRFLRENYARNLTMEEIAGHVHLHPNYLSVLFKQSTGKTVMTQLYQLRMSKACELLRHSNLPVSQIAELCGFQSPGFFTRRFRQELSCAPSAYRKQLPPER